MRTGREKGGTDTFPSSTLWLQGFLSLTCLVEKLLQHGPRLVCDPQETRGQPWGDRMF